LLGRRFAVRAKVTPLLGFSAHADREDLLAALSPHAQSTGALFLVHGEDDQRDPLARELRERGFQRVETPDDSRPFVF
jgi:metallo-beta-lactamase family protein